MPIYSYRCTPCEEQFDELQKMADHASCSCPSCGEPAKQVITAVHFDVMGMGTDPNGCPTFADKFEKQMLQQKRKEEKSYREHGDYGPAPGA